ncbi:MAG: Fe-S cluster assembly protein SufB [Patescibacteria group bacterium]|nr:Fe-S cluster assembly protein SufB [Patescibacteria group bacterium]
MIPANKHTNEAIYQAAPERLVFRTPKGLTRKIVEEISRQKNEPGWMREKRLKAFAIFEAKPMPQWGVDLSGLRFDDLTFYLRSDKEQFQSWEEVPEDIKKVYSLLKIPEAEQKWLAGFVGQYESEGFYAKLKKEWEAKGVIFCDTDTALQKYPELVKQYFMSRCVPIGDHKFAALHGAVWSGGSFVYIPAGVRVSMPLQTYFRMNARKSGQFEHTLIIAEEGSFVHYIESCTAPRYSADSLHSAVVEIFVKKNAHVRYTTIQNWSKDVYNLNTKRAIVYEGGTMEWVGGSMGSKRTMLYPCSVLLGRGARADHINIAVASKDQWKDTGAKVILAAPDTSANIISKSIAMHGGRSSYRGLVKINPGAKRARVFVRCDALMTGDAQSDTYPYVEVYEQESAVAHEASCGRISEEALFYLRARGMTEKEAQAMIVRGFIEPVTAKLPMDYAVELNKLVELEMEGAIG